jgi:hypothetical protein
LCKPANHPISRTLDEYSTRTVMSVRVPYRRYFGRKIKKYASLPSFMSTLIHLGKLHIVIVNSLSIGMMIRRQHNPTIDQRAAALWFARAPVVKNKPIGVWVDVDLEEVVDCHDGT